MTIKTISALVGFIVLISGSTAGVITFFETKVNADSEREILAEDRETGDLRTRLELIEIKIQRLKDFSEIRDLSEAERIELRSLESERQVILERLAEKA